mmetsp:Transcript_38206/g.92453  ORF Transcript_38206/g.92453 Transcript_38206/m.92453 type:complete len:168 (-) Transcript_38206:132-635(-)|eukprot:CAMPEP_0113632174 /NCGR_PEP_ID=MMETSP0017_2-20120614/16720_1 /TAXON_ID=2856 /ORGANISM="Cylindrotheca closterium" /LENGTH=167 /DNA_ID=CAMNT_0000542713 /DNA_START=120 /DNA_END=623 /DNA_ORIENTATION=- /assembly_acc=CAM_ASM_000147
MTATIEDMPKYCCGCCDSRTAALTANILSLMVGILYFVVGILALSGPSSADKADERLTDQTLVGLSAMQIIINALATWGACTYRGWPMMLSLGWISVGMSLLAIGSFVAVVTTEDTSFLLRGVFVLVFQWALFWMPMYGYVCEYEKLKEIAVAREMEMGGKQNLEMV